MNSFKTILGIMTKRLLTKRNIIIFIVIAVALFLLVNEGKNGYVDVVKNKKEFRQMEEEKVKNYVYYDQYANYGIKILFMSSPFIALRSDAIVDEITANINIGERLNISMTLGKNFSIENPGFLDFIGIFLILAVTCGLIAGVEITAKDDYATFLYLENNSITQFLKPVLSTVILITAAFLALMLPCLVWLLIHGINLFTGHYMILLLGIILVAAFFVALGTVVGNFKFYKSTKWTSLIIIIVFCVVFIPWITEKVNKIAAPNITPVSGLEFENLKILMGAEKRIHDEIGTFKNDGNISPEITKKIIERDRQSTFKEIEENESQRLNKINKSISTRQTLMSFFPITFALSLNKEISGFGDESYLEFQLYGQKIKAEFREYILKKKFYEEAKPGKVEPFKIDGEDKNIFYARSHLPHNFWLGVLLTLLYTSVLLYISFNKQAKRLKKPDNRWFYPLTFKEGNTHHIQCGTAAIKENIFNHYRLQEGVACIGRVNAEEFHFTGVTPSEVLDHLCILSGVEKQRVAENLRLMGIKDITAFKENSRQLTLKIILAIETAVDCDRVVLDEFFLDEAKEFERSVINYLVTLSNKGKKIIYLSLHPFQMANKIDDGIDVGDFLILPMNLAVLSFR